MATTKKDLTDLMHFRTLQALYHLKNNRLLPIRSIKAEQSVLLESNGKEKSGRFDFLVELADGTLWGLEVLSRPTKGKLKEKLPYSGGVDEFVFVLPDDSMELYQNPKKPIYKKNPKHALGKEFNSSKLFVWPFHMRRKELAERKSLNEWFNVTRR